MTIKFQNVIIDVPNKNKTHDKKYLRLVNNISGEFRYGELTAIMGPSGCGKSTFVAALVGRIQEGSKTSGSIAIDGKEREYRSFIENIGLLEQDDNVYPNLTLYETLSYAMEFRLKKSKTKENRKAYIDSLIQKLGLNHVRLNQMGKLSGGERKRSMLAIEIIADPKIIIADEPTSGLDTKTALNIMSLLKKLADDGKMVICCIHQPSVEIFSLFNDVLLMTEGQTVYFGPANTFEKHLEEQGITKRPTISFPDFIAEMVSREIIYDQVNIHHDFVTKVIAKNIEDNKKSDYIAKVKKSNDNVQDFQINFKHIMLIYNRKMKLYMRRKAKILKSFIMPIISAILLWIVNLMFSLVFKDIDEALEILEKNNSDDIIGMFLEYGLFPIRYNNVKVYVVFYLFSLISTNIGAFIDQKSVIVREINNGSYSPTSYVLGYYIFNIIRTYLIQSPLTILMLILCWNKITGTVLFVHFVFPVLLVPYAFMLGSLFRNSKAVLAVSALLTIPLCIPASCIRDISYLLFLYDLSGFGVVFTAIMTVLSFSPIYHVCALYYLAISNFFTRITQINKLNMSNLQDEYVDLLPRLQMHYISTVNNLFHIIPYSAINIYSMGFLVSGMILLSMTVTIYRQNTFLMPKVRMNLSK